MDRSFNPAFTGGQVSTTVGLRGGPLAGRSYTAPDMAVAFDVSRMTLNDDLTTTDVVDQYRKVAPGLAVHSSWREWGVSQRYKRGDWRSAAIAEEYVLGAFDRLAGGKAGPFIEAHLVDDTWLMTATAWFCPEGVDQS